MSLRNYLYEGKMKELSVHFNALKRACKSCKTKSDVSDAVDKYALKNKEVTTDAKSYLCGELCKVLNCLTEDTTELASELKEFQNYIDKHDLKVTVVKIENEELVVYQDKKPIVKWDVTEANRVRTKVLTNPKKASYYAMVGKETSGYKGGTLNSTAKWLKEYDGWFELMEPIIATDADEAVNYAVTSERRFVRGEPTISKDVECSYLYAKKVINGRFDLGEPTISKDAPTAVRYARNIIQGRWAEAEKTIEANPEAFKYYKRVVLRQE